MKIRAADASQNTGSRQAVEWPTWLLFVIIHGGWVLLILDYRSHPAWLANLALILLATWHLSLQHELLHGHPTRSKTFNRLLGLFPISAWYPYDIYRDSHIAHHRDELLTMPGIDPESNYLAAQAFDRLSKLQRVFKWSLRTALGRLLLGPAFALTSVWAGMVIGPLKRDYRYLATWVVHLTLLVPMLWWVNYQADLSPLHYLFGVAYPAMSLAMLRSFFEHRPSALPAHRVVINDAAIFWRVLYLNNNYHAVHHEQPDLAWYRIPAAYQADREGFLQRNDGFQLPGYGHLLWRYVCKPVDSPVHPGFGPTASHEITAPTSPIAATTR